MSTLHLDTACGGCLRVHFLVLAQRQLGVPLPLPPAETSRANVEQELQLAETEVEDLSTKVHEQNMIISGLQARMDELSDAPLQTESLAHDSASTFDADALQDALAEKESLERRTKELAAQLHEANQRERDVISSEKKLQIQLEEASRRDRMRTMEVCSWSGKRSAHKTFATVSTVSASKSRAAICVGIIAHVPHMSCAEILSLVLVMLRSMSVTSENPISLWDSVCEFWSASSFLAWCCTLNTPAVARRGEPPRHRKTPARGAD